MTDFRTNRGRCIIDERNVHLTSSIEGQFRRYLEGGPFGYFLVATYFALIVLLGFQVYMGNSGPVMLGFGIGITIILISRIVNFQRGFVRDRKISKQYVESVSLNEGKKGFTNPRFVIEFEKEGELKKRYVMMPSKIFRYTDEEIEKAKEIFKDEGFELKA